MYGGPALFYVSNELRASDAAWPDLHKKRTRIHVHVHLDFYVHHDDRLYVSCPVSCLNQPHDLDDKIAIKKRRNWFADHDDPKKLPKRNRR